jgi:hypothetical protein
MVINEIRAIQLIAYGSRTHGLGRGGTGKEERVEEGRAYNEPPRLLITAPNYYSNMRKIPSNQNRLNMFVFITRVPVHPVLREMTSEDKSKKKGRKSIENNPNVHCRLCKCSLLVKFGYSGKVCNSVQSCMNLFNPSAREGSRGVVLSSLLDTSYFLSEWQCCS